MLSVAGNETTRNATTMGMMAFLEHPDQWELFKSARPSTTVDEIVRYTSPLIAQQRTALQDTVIGDVRIRAGERVVMLYPSANFDEEVFENPHAFDITRDPNPHLGFGGTGAHYCLGPTSRRRNWRSSSTRSPTACRTSRGSGMRPGSIPAGSTGSRSSTRRTAPSRTDAQLCCRWG